MAIGDFSLLITAGSIFLFSMFVCFYMSERQKKNLATSMALVAAARHMTVILPMTSPDTLPAYTPRFVVVTIPPDMPPSYEAQNTPPTEATGEAPTSLSTQEPIMEQQTPVYPESTFVSRPLSSSSPPPQHRIASQA